MEFLTQLVQGRGNLLALVAVLITGYVAVYLLLQRSLNRTVEKLRGEWAEEFRSLMVAARLEGKQAPELSPSDVPVSHPIAMPLPTASVIAKKEEVSPETLLLIAAAVTAFLGKKVRIRSAKMLYSHESFNAWSQQGRAVVQASHNVAQRVH
jgi:hypothetical protein